MRSEIRSPSLCRNKPCRESRQTSSARRPVQSESRCKSRRRSARAMLVRQTLHAFQKPSGRRPEVYGLHDHRGKLTVVLVQQLCATTPDRCIRTDASSPARLAARPRCASCCRYTSPASRDSRNTRFDRARECARRPHRARSCVRTVLAKPHFLGARNQPRQALRQFHFQRMRQRKTVALRQLLRRPPRFTPSCAYPRISAIAPGCSRCTHFRPHPRRGTFALCEEQGATPRTC